MAILKDLYTWTSATPWAASAGDTTGPAYFIQNKLTTWMSAVPDMANWLIIQRSPFQCTTFNSTTVVSWLFRFPELADGYMRWCVRPGNATTASTSTSQEHWWGWTSSTANNNTGTPTTTLAAMTPSNGIIRPPTATVNAGISVIYDTDATLPWFAIVHWLTNTPSDFRLQVIARLDTSSSSIGSSNTWPTQAAKWGFFNFGGSEALETAIPALSNAAPGYGTSISGYSSFPGQGFVSRPGVSGILSTMNPYWADSHPGGMPNPDLFRMSVFNFASPGESIAISGKTFTKIATSTGGLWMRTG